MITYKVIINDFGSIFWYDEKEQFHCEHGPAVEWVDGTKWWYLNGERHREDGPAIEYPDGSVEYYLNGEELTEEEYARAMSPVKELSVSEIEKILGYSVKIIKE